MTSPKQTSLFGEDESTFSQEGFPANHIAQPESEREKKTNAISGQKCLEQFGKFSHVGLWAKTFSELLIGTGEWYSKRCKLTWKLKGTKYKRMYFQLQVSTLPTKDTASGLLLTPTSVMTLEDPKEMRARAEKNGYKNGTQYGSLLSQVVYGGLLPTPSASDGTRGLNGNQTTVENGRFVRTSETTGTKFGASLGMAAATGLLPTPREAAARGNCSVDRGKGNLEDVISQLLPTPCADDDPHKNTGNRNQDGLQKRAFQTTGKTSQLNPRFVLEMMGFEPSHCDSAFEKIAWDYYLKKKSTKSFQKRLADGSKKL